MSVDHPGLDQVAVFGVDADLDLRGLDLHAAGAGDIGRAQGRVLAQLLLTAAAEGFGMLGTHAAVFQNIPHLPIREGQRLRVLALLMDSHALRELLMHGLHHVKAAILLQTLAQDFAEQLLLPAGGNGRLGAENSVHKILMPLAAVLGVEQGVIDIGGAPVKCREKEAQLRRCDRLPDGCAVKALFLRRIAQLRLALLHRADAADKIPVGISSAVLVKLPILAVMGHIIDIKGHEDEIIALLHVEIVHNAAAKFLSQGGVLQLGFAKLAEELVLLPVHDLLGGKADVQQVFAQSAGEPLFQKAQVFFRKLFIYINIILFKAAFYMIDKGFYFLICPEFSRAYLINEILYVFTGQCLHLHPLQRRRTLMV